MRGFAIHFVAPGHVTIVHIFLEKMRSCGAESLSFAAIRTVADRFAGVSSLITRQQSIGRGTGHLRQAERLRSRLRLRGKKLRCLIAGQTQGGGGAVVGVVRHLRGVHGRGRRVVHVPPQPWVGLRLDVGGSGLPGGVGVDSGGVHGLHVLKVSYARRDRGRVHAGH